MFQVLHGLVRSCYTTDIQFFFNLLKVSDRKSLLACSEGMQQNASIYRHVTFLSRGCRAFVGPVFPFIRLWLHSIDHLFRMHTKTISKMILLLALLAIVAVWWYYAWRLEQLH